MDKPELSRRKLLAGFGTAGGTGLTVGTGTSALFSDTETFTNNNIEASSNVAGVVDIDVTIDSTDSPSIIYSISLPTDVNNNPSHVWVRSVDCPGANPDVTVRLKNSGSTQIFTGKLKEFLTTSNNGGVREGKLLDPGNSDSCLEPGESYDLEIELDSNPTSDANFTLKFYGEQCRYNTDSGTNPFSDEGPSDCS
jgi:predicted ribosomally synthesized peptide with SipW-like signal peptide